MDGNTKAVFSYRDEIFLDVDSMKWIVSDDRLPVFVSYKKLLNIFSKMNPSPIESHVRHVDRTVPIIIGDLPGVGKIVVDGIHRMTYAMRSGKGIKAHLLTRRETLICKDIGMIRKRNREFQA